MNSRIHALFAWSLFEALRRAVFDGSFAAGDALAAAGRRARVHRAPWLAGALFRAAAAMFRTAAHMTAIGDVAVTRLEDF